MKPRQQDVETLPELVLFLEEPLHFNVEFLQGAVHSAFGELLPIDEPNAEEFVTGEFPIFFVQIKGRLLQIKSMFLPYFDREVQPFVSGDPAAMIRNVTDAAFKKVMMRHQGWISVALMNPDIEPEGKNPYRYPSRMISAFAYEEIVALALPAENKLIPFGNEMQEVLYKGRGKSLFDS